MERNTSSSFGSCSVDALRLNERVSECPEDPKGSLGEFTVYEVVDDKRDRQPRKA